MSPACGPLYPCPYRGFQKLGAYFVCGFLEFSTQGFSILTGPRRCSLAFLTMVRPRRGQDMTSTYKPVLFHFIQASQMPGLFSGVDSDD